MTKDIGIVFLPNEECKDFALHMTSEAAKKLIGFKQAINNPHITAIHIANLGADSEAKIKEVFREFYDKYSSTCINLPVKNEGINPTGGNLQEGYKWLDLQFDTLPALAELRQAAVDIFCPFHNGTLT
jgi:hypothetical protein